MSPPTPSRSLGLIESVFIQFSVKRFGIDTKNVGGLAPMFTGLMQNVQNVLFFHFFETSVFRAVTLQLNPVKIQRLQNITPVEQYGPLEYIQ